MKIKSIILSQLVYTNNNQFNVINAVAFNERVPINQTVLLINPIPAPPAAITRIDADSETANHSDNERRNHAKFIHFKLDNLTCNQLYTYHIEVNKIRIDISKLYKHDERSQPQPDMTFQIPTRTHANIRIAMGGDQEAIQLFTSKPWEPVIDSKYKATTRIYQEIKNPPGVNSFNAFIHLSDIFHGESI